MIDCFVPYMSKSQVKETVSIRQGKSLVAHVTVLARSPLSPVMGCEVPEVVDLTSSETIAVHAHSDRTWFNTKSCALLQLGSLAPQRLWDIAPQH